MYQDEEGDYFRPWVSDGDLGSSQQRVSFVLLAWGWSPLHFYLRVSNRALNPLGSSVMIYN